MALRRICWALLSLAALGLYLFNNGPATLLLLLAVVVIPLAEGAAFLLSRPGLEADWDLEEHIERGKALPWALTLRQEGGLPFSALTGEIRIANLLTGEAQTIPLSRPLKKGGCRMDFTLTPAHCGVIELQLERVCLWDGLGLFCRRLSPPTGPRVLVEPVITPVNIRVDEFWRDSDRYSTTRPGTDPSETFRIREYVPGDPIRQIHWKLSEKVDKPLVRDYGLPLGERVLLTLAEAPAAPEEVDAALDLLFSLGRALLELGRPATVIWPDRGDRARMDLYGEEDWLALQQRLFSAPLAPVSLQIDGTTIV